MSDDVQALPTPSMLDEKYRVESLLAVGGMGAVYRGTHTKLKKTVAIKVLKQELVGSPELVERFQREAVAASQIGHEGIIEVTDLGTSTSGHPFLVMEFLEGRDLAQCLRDLGPLSPGTAVRLCREILSALAAAHDKAIIHRDLKPENIFMARRSGGERLKIVDFGISRMPVEGDESMRLTSTGMVMGTPYYMSPEQAIGDSNINKAADLYSVGVILYELITGAVPFQATNYNALLHQILLGEYPAPSQLAQVSPELEAEIIKAMSIHPEDRHSDARSMSAALERFAEESPTPLLIALGPELDTLDDGRPALATAPTRASSVDLGMATFDTELREGDNSYVDGTDTLKPVVTPVPEDWEPPRSRKSWGAIAAVMGLVLAGGATAVLSGGGGDENTIQSASSAGPRAILAAPGNAVPVNAVPLPVVEEPSPGAIPELLTLTFAIAPHDAEVFVDGEKIEGKSIERPAGSFVVEVRREGYESQSKSIEVDASEKIAFVLTETEAPAGSEASLAAPAKKSATGRKKKSQKRQVKDKTPSSEKIRNRRFVEDSPYDAP